MKKELTRVSSQGQGREANEKRKKRENPNLISSSGRQSSAQRWQKKECPLGGKKKPPGEKKKRECKEWVGSGGTYFW